MVIERKKNGKTHTKGDIEKMIVTINRNFCPYCESKDFVFFGNRYNECGIVQRYRCNDCSKTFTNRKDEFLRMKYDEEKIAEAVNLFLKGLSSRQIRKKLKISASHKSIISWVTKYMQNPKFDINASHRPEVRERIALSLLKHFKRNKKIKANNLLGVY